MLTCGCDPCLEGGYGEDGRSSRYSMEWCPLHAAAPEMARALQNCVNLCEAGFKQFNMAGPDREKMGAVWFDTYVAFKAILAKIEVPA